MYFPEPFPEPSLDQVPVEQLQPFDWGGFQHRDAVRPMIAGEVGRHTPSVQLRAKRAQVPMRRPPVRARRRQSRRGVRLRHRAVQW